MSPLRPLGKDPDDTRGRVCLAPLSRRALFAAEDLCGISRSLSRSTVQHHVLELIGLMRACPGLDFLDFQDFFLHPQEVPS